MPSATRGWIAHKLRLDASGLRGAEQPSMRREQRLHAQGGRGSLPVLPRRPLGGSLVHRCDLCRLLELHGGSNSVGLRRQLR
ncbi:hypothetical protein MRX96_001656 [Rhipicephalus microplus]